MVRIGIAGGVIPQVLKITAVVLLAVVTFCTRRRFRSIGVALGVAAAIAVAVAVLVPTVPRTFALWASASLFAMSLTAVGWRGSLLRPKLISVLAVAIVVIATCAVVNEHYGYYPTMADLLHRPLPDQITATVALGPRRPSPAVLLGAGRLVRVHIGGTVSQFRHRAEWVYLPPAWFVIPRPRLPVVVLLPGTPGTTDDWVRAGGAVRTANRWAAAHDGRAPILVFADPNASFAGDSECVDRPHAKVDTYLSVDLPRFITTTFETSADPANWAIVGVSAGGTCAVTVALRHPDVYRTLVSLSGDTRPSLGDRRSTLRRLFGGSPDLATAYEPLSLMSRRDYHSTHALFTAAAGDRAAQRAVRALAPAAGRAYIDTRTHVRRAGGHTWRYWRAAFAEHFAWLVQTIDTSGAPHGR